MSGNNSSKVPQNYLNETRKCKKLCALVPTVVPKDPAACQGLLHPKKDVFVFKVAKVGPTGDRRCKMELELVTPKYSGGRKLLPLRVDTRETQCEEVQRCPCACECTCDCNPKCKKGKKR